MALGEPGAGEFILITDFSKEAVGAILHQVQHGITRFNEAKGRKCRGYKMNYHSSKGELLALDYRLKKFSKFLHQGPFTVRSHNATVIHWETMNADEAIKNIKKMNNSKNTDYCASFSENSSNSHGPR